MIQAIVFDLNGTLLDLSYLDPYFVRLFGLSSARQRWFDQLQILWLTTIATNRYQPLDKLADAALTMLAQRDGVTLEETVKQSLLSAMTTLPPFPDVPAALSELSESKVKLLALTNGTLSAAKSQLSGGGVYSLFHEVLSADWVFRYKPARDPYDFALKKADLPPEQVLMVAAHGWDLTGAHQLGMKTAFVKRPGQVLCPLDPAPDVTVENLRELVAYLKSPPAPSH